MKNTLEVVTIYTLGKVRTMARIFSIDEFNGGLTLSKRKNYAFTCVTFKNGTRTQLKAAEGAKIIYILSGELDLKVEHNLFRLKAGHWANIPKGKNYGVNVYRSFEPCKFIILTCLQGAIDNHVIYGDVNALPLMRSTASFSLFGQESEVMQAKHIEFREGDTWVDKSKSEAFVYAEKGNLKVNFMYKGFDIPEGSVVFIPGHFKFTVIPESGEATALVVTSPVDMAKTKEYVNWLKDEHGLLWEEGAIEV